MFIQPYLFFEGRCDEALAFYQEALGAEVTTLMRVKDSPDPTMMHGDKEKVLHCSFRIGDSTILASDGQCLAPPKFQGFALTITVPNEAEAQRLFAPLCEGGQILMPLTKTFYSPLFGMVADRFGIMWMILTAQ
jgi:PhnB protein